MNARQHPSQLALPRPASCASNLTRCCPIKVFKDLCNFAMAGFNEVENASNSIVIEASSNIFFKSFVSRTKKFFPNCVSLLCKWSRAASASCVKPGTHAQDQLSWEEMLSSTSLQLDVTLKYCFLVSSASTRFCSNCVLERFWSPSALPFVRFRVLGELFGEGF